MGLPYSRSLTARKYRLTNLTKSPSNEFKLIIVPEQQYKGTELVKIFGTTPAWLDNSVQFIKHGIRYHFEWVRR